MCAWALTMQEKAVQVTNIATICLQKHLKLYLKQAYLPR